MAIVTANGIDNTGYNHSSELSVGIDYRPGQAYVNLTNICNSSPWVDHEIESMVQVSSNNQVWQFGNKVSIDIFSNWIDGKSYHSANINNLTSEWKDWKMGKQNTFVNPIGGTLSNPVYHFACKRNGFPDPVYAEITITTNPADNFIKLTLKDPVNIKS